MGAGLTGDGDGSAVVDGVVRTGGGGAGSSIGGGGGGAVTVTGAEISGAGTLTTGGGSSEPSGGAGLIETHPEKRMVATPTARIALIPQ